MRRAELIKQTILGVLLFLGVCWSLADASKESTAGSYPNADILASADWLKQHLDDTGVVIVDVRTDKYFKGELIPGAIRMPWKQFRYNNTGKQVGSVFVGLNRAQEILGDHGIMPTDTVVLYDSVKRDGGATASYVFWILDVLGHPQKKVLNGGIDAWRAAGGGVVTNAVERSPVLYQADADRIQPRRWADGAFVEKRLGDPYYQIIDVRSHAEYVGDKGNKDLHGKPLKLGHIPTALNVDYTRAWIDEESKQIKPYAELKEVYRGIDPRKAAIVYCHSGRRGSFGYFVLRLMGFHDVIEYEGSWNEWGSPRNFFPTELTENVPATDTLPEAGSSDTTTTQSSRNTQTRSSSGGSDTASGGYISCGG